MALAMSSLLNGAAGSSHAAPDGEYPVSLQLLQAAERVAYDAVTARYGLVSLETWERLLWLVAAAELSQPLVEWCLTVRSQRVQAEQQM
ncbi:hypothetical protein HaLaN_26201 [Haematococcus lacustris]|uniref:Uncharacterized protein n=1 Tax=Haematococcus lacustris TaxID=44745 RepID=A0A6A0A5N3_HAELA|nr:hypothetical protein HaLaN_26201 [Haematococcus lacustris]